VGAITPVPMRVFVAALLVLLLPAAAAAVVALVLWRQRRRTPAWCIPIWVLACVLLAKSLLCRHRRRLAALADRNLT